MQTVFVFFVRVKNRPSSLQLSLFLSPIFRYIGVIADLVILRHEIYSTGTYILRKTIEGYKTSFDYITFEKIIPKQSIFASDRNTNMQCS